jgi:nucleoid-associated protein YgaU
MQAFFQAQGYLGLALLEVEGELVDGVLQLSGEVPSANERTTVVELAEAVEGAELVAPDEITINPPLTYTINVGDSLWTISTYFYGDIDHMNDIFRLNREALGSPEFLPVGAVIELPRYEEE